MNPMQISEFTFRSSTLIIELIKLKTIIDTKNLNNWNLKFRDVNAQ